MSLLRKWSLTLLTALLTIVAVGSWQSATADDIFHAVTGVVKSVDSATKTMVVKTADGTEHTIKYTDDTTVKGAKDVGKGMEKASVDTYLAGKKGATVTVKYSEKGGEKTAVGVKDASKATAKAVTN